MTINAHYDGKTIVLDEPATLVAGQKLKVVVEPTLVVESSAIPKLITFGMLADASRKMSTEEDFKSAEFNENVWANECI